jgi:hypothetical protein
LEFRSQRRRFANVRVALRFTLTSQKKEFGLSNRG